MKKKYNFIVINFFRVTDPYSGASEVSFDFFKNIPCKRKRLFQFSDTLKKHNKVESIIIKNTKIQKLLNLKKFAEAIIKFASYKKNLVIVFEGASWTGYTFVVYNFLKKKLIDAKFIYHSHNIEYLLRKNKSNFIIANLTKYFENYIAKNFDIFTCVSKKDKKKLKKIYNIDATILSNGIGLSKKVNKIKSKKFHFKYIFFCGSIDYYPNYDALKILIEKIMPIVIKNIPKIKLIVTGNKFLPFKNKFLINAGFVTKNTFFKYLRGASLFVNPIQITFGVQTKTLHALALGKTIISTKHGVSGIKLNSVFKNTYITNNNKKFAELIVNKINSKKMNKKSSDHYFKEYSIKKIVYNFCKKKLLV